MSLLRALGAALGIAGLAACGPDRPTNFGTDVPVARDASDAPSAEGGQCAQQSDCDDHVACTDDACLFGGVCEHVANDRLCASGERCFPARGCAAARSCGSNADCDDHVPCTQDLCAAGGACQNIRDDSRCANTQVCSAVLGCVAMGTCGGDVDCDDGVFCNGTERCSSGHCAGGTAPDCSDGDPCTADLCSETTRMCSHPPVDPCGGTVMPGTYDLAPPPTYSCGAGSFGPVASVMLSASATSVTITGFPVTLTGPAPSMGMFSASGTQSQGTCRWEYTLSGAFTMARRFAGSWNLAFSNCSTTLGCLSQFGEVTGTLR